MTPRRTPPAPRSVPAPLGEAEIDELQALIDRLPAPLEPLDVSTLDGYLCGVLVQPEPVPRERWLVGVTDLEGRRLPTGVDASRLHALVGRRHAELEDAIRKRRWFDPWIFALEPDAGGDDGGDGDADEVDAVFPWVVGFSIAVETFPALLERGGEALTDPLALLYAHLDPDDLEEDEALTEAIASNEPPTDLTEAVEQLVRATLLLADVAEAAGPAHPKARRRPPDRRR